MRDECREPVPDKAHGRADVHAALVRVPEAARSSAGALSHYRLTMAWYERDRTTAAVLAGGMAVLAAVAVVLDSSDRVCPAVGYGNVSPIELTIDPTLGVDSVEVCLGADCQPEALPPDADGTWSVPQSQPYLQHAPAGSITHVRVRALAAAGAPLVDRAFDVQRESDGGSLWDECPGPWRYLPVVIRHADP